MPDIYLLRHGETPWNADGNRYCGRTDLSLTEKGIRQATSVRDLLKDLLFEAVYASPLRRAYQTAQIAGGGCQVITDERLTEVDFGRWEGQTREEFIREDEALWNSWCADPATTRAGGSGETAGEVIARVQAFFSDLSERHPQGNVLVVAHNGINRLYLAHKLGMNLRYYRRIVQENSSATMFSLAQDGELTLKMLNCRC